MVIIKNIYFKNLDINIKCGELVCIVGPIGSGKTTLLKMINNKIKNNYIYIDDKNVNNYGIDFKRNNIVCVFNDNIYNTEYPKDELKYYLQILQYSGKDLNSRLDYFTHYFKLDNIINLSFSELSNKDRIFIKILSLLIIKPSLFCIDDLLTYLDNYKKNMILNYIKDNNITLVSVISDIEESLLFDKFLILNNDKAVVFDKIDNILTHAKIFDKLGLSMPFIYNINELLKSYDLIDDNHIVEKDLVDILWK